MYWRIRVPPDIKEDPRAAEACYTFIWFYFYQQIGCELKHARWKPNYRILANVGSHRFLFALLVPRLAAVSVFTWAAPRLVPDEPFFLYLLNPLPLSCKAHWDGVTTYQHGSMLWKKHMFPFHQHNSFYTLKDHQFVFNFYKILRKFGRGNGHWEIAMPATSNNGYTHAKCIINNSNPWSNKSLQVTYT